MSKVNSSMFSSGTDEWGTPKDLFDQLDSEFHFNLDVASTDENCKCEMHFTKEDDGLKKDWSGRRVFCNPPYSQISRWIRSVIRRIGKKSLSASRIRQTGSVKPAVSNAVDRENHLTHIKGR